LHPNYLSLLHFVDIFSDILNFQALFETKIIDNPDLPAWGNEVFSTYPALHNEDPQTLIYIGKECIYRSLFEQTITDIPWHKIQDRSLLSKAKEAVINYTLLMVLVLSTSCHTNK
jgi:hypothetical protein